jgi:hypothetical protein
MTRVIAGATTREGEQRVGALNEAMRRIELT